MWIATIDGFYSAVQHREMPDVLIIRARHRDDLLAITPGIGAGDAMIVDTPAADYPCRIEVTKDEWADYLTRATMAIDYDNFKNAVFVRSGPDREHIYHGVWAVMRRLTNLPPQRRVRKSVRSTTKAK